MTADERIAQLEASLALERAKVHELSAALAAAVTADARAKEAAAVRKAARAAQNRAAYERRKQSQQQIQRTESSAEMHAETPSPPLDGSPLSSKPSLPSPLSSPQPISASQEPEGSEREELRLTSPTSKRGRKQRKSTAAEDLFRNLQKMREERCAEVGEPVVEERWDFAKQNTLLRDDVNAPDAAKERFAVAWGLYLADDGQRERLPAWSLAFFMSSGVRAKYETLAAREGEAA